MTSTIQTLRTGAIVLVATLIMACQGETVAQEGVDVKDATNKASAAAESMAKDKVAQATAQAKEAVKNMASEKANDAATTVQNMAKEKAAAVTENAADAADSLANKTAAQAEVAANKTPTTVDASKYQAVSKPMTVSTGDKIEVVELFWFGCGHCFALEPSIKKWKKDIPANAEFKKVPAVFSARWEFHAQAFYTMKALGAPEEAYDKFFNKLHVERKQINNIGQLASFLKEFGKTEDQVESAFGSFDVDSKMRLAKKITRDSGARGVPAMVVDGKYLTSQTLSGGTDQMFDVVNQLVAKSASER